MMRTLAPLKVLALALGMFFVLVCLAGRTEAASRITIDELNAMPADQVTIIDVRTEGSWEKSDQKIKGAIRENPNEVEVWANKYPKDKTLVLYCS